MYNSVKECGTKHKKTGKSRSFRKHIPIFVFYPAGTRERRWFFLDFPENFRYRKFLCKGFSMRGIMVY